MSITRRSHLQRFRNFVLESQDEASLVTFAFSFAEPPLLAIEAYLVALEVSGWLQSALGLEDGANIMSAVEDDLGVYGWNVGVVARDANPAGAGQGDPGGLRGDVPGAASAPARCARLRCGTAVRARDNYHAPTLIWGGPMRATPSPEQLGC